MRSKKFNSEQEVIEYLLTTAIAEDGYCEKATNSQLNSKTENSGSNNYTKYWADLKPSFQGQPWCNAYVNWVFVEVFGETVAKQLLCTTNDWSYYTPTSAQYFKNKNRWTTTPQIGSVIYFKNSTRIYHVGLVYKIDDKYVYTIEGNTSASGTNYVQNEGGAVCKKFYTKSYSKIAGYGLPLYKDLVEENAELTAYDIKVGEKGLVVSVDGSLNIRSYPKTGESIGTLKNGEIIFPTKKTFVNNDVWYYLPDYNGWISAKYIDGGWVYESSTSSPRKWWFIHKDYSCTTNDIEVIDGKIYMFDNSGYMYENEPVTIMVDKDGIVCGKNL